MNILLIGSGGREHALAWRLAQSPKTARLYVAPGNPGTACVAENVVIDVLDHDAVIDFCRIMDVGFCLVGPEAPLVAGLVDALSAAGILAFGPTREAARLEGSKAFTKALCDRFAIPTARYAVFSDVVSAMAHVSTSRLPVVVKADGLAAGKGVVVAATLEEAENAVDRLLATGSSLVIEEFLDGEEASFFALSDGFQVVSCGSARDYKRLGNGDTGPNTGGMGAVSPAFALTPALEACVMREIIEPTIAGMRARGTPFRGVLFAGLMLTRDGPKLIEYNVRFGDPECQVLMLRLDEDLLPRLIGCAEGRLADTSAVRFRPDVAVTVVLAAPGYPDAPVKGSRIGALDRAARLDGATIFHAGTKRIGDALTADGGRVLCVSAVGDTAGVARARAYAAVAAVDWPEARFRRDIGADAGSSPAPLEPRGSLPYAQDIR